MSCPPSACHDCPRRPSRRAVLAGAGALGAAGLLSACGGGSGTPTASTGADDPVITELATLREQGAVVFDSAEGKAIAVVTGSGVAAFSGVCTHDGCTVGWDAEEKQIACPCHGSRFEPSDGSVITGPARDPLGEVPGTVDEAGGVLRRG